MGLKKKYKIFGILVQDGKRINSTNFTCVRTMSSFNRYRTILFALLPAMLPATQAGLQAAQTSYAPQILQYVREDKVYLLENIRKNLSIPSEKLVVDALLAEDGPQAAYLYRKQLAEYPDPSLDEISTARLSLFQVALNQPLAFPETVPPMTPPPAAVMPAKKIPTSSQPSTQLPATAPERPTQQTAPGPALDPVTQTDSAQTLFTLQFGSFGKRANAEKLAMQLSAYGQVSIVQEGGMHKVRLQQTWQSENQALDAARSIPFTSVAVPLR